MAQTVKITPALGTVEFIGNTSLAASTSAIFTGNTAGSIFLAFPASQGIEITGFLTVVGSITATSFIKSGGTSAQFLKADGSVDSSTYLTSETDSQELEWDAPAKNLSISNGNTITLEGLATEEFVTGQGYLTSYTETDTLQSVTSRGSTTTTGASFGGNVGIGTTSPGAKLEINDTNKAINTKGNLFVSTTDALAVDKGGQISLGGVWSGTSQIQFAGIAGRKENSTSGSAGGYLQLSTTNSAGGNLTERMRITSAGNVGIGTISPDNKLMIESVDDSMLRFTRTGVRSWKQYIGSTGNLIIRDLSGTPADRVTIDTFNYRKPGRLVQSRYCCFYS